jgi:UDP-glucose 4-epimerase
VQTWIACGADSYSTREIYDLLRAALGKGPGVAWLPHWVWQWGSYLLDRFFARGAEPTYTKLFGWELYDNAAVVQWTGWRPRIKLEDVLEEWVIAPGIEP